MVLLAMQLPGAPPAATDNIPPGRREQLADNIPNPSADVKRARQTAIRNQCGFRPQTRSSELGIKDGGYGVNIIFTLRD